MSQPRVVLIGGGTGSFTLLQGLKQWTENITAIVNMSDDGGSSGELRDELGVLPPGDVRQCLVALSNNPNARAMFSYRFADGKFNGHPVGNIILSALELQTGSFVKAVKIVAELMQLTGQVVPVSTKNHQLVLIDGKQTIIGEFKISSHRINSENATVCLKPKATINPEAGRAIKTADMVIIAPGNLYSSLLPSLCTEGMAAALNSTKAKIVMVANLINKPLHTPGWHVIDYLQAMERYIGQGTVDLVLYNTKLPTKDLLAKYAEENEFPVSIEPAKFNLNQTETLGFELLDSNIYQPDPGDKQIRRTLIRHDAYAVTAALKSYLYSK